MQVILKSSFSIKVKRRVIPDISGARFMLLNDPEIGFLIYSFIEASGAKVIRFLAGATMQALGDALLLMTAGTTVAIIDGGNRSINVLDGIEKTKLISNLARGVPFLCPFGGLKRAPLLIETDDEAFPFELDLGFHCSITSGNCPASKRLMKHWTAIGSLYSTVSMPVLFSFQ